MIFEWKKRKVILLFTKQQNLKAVLKMLANEKSWSTQYCTPVQPLVWHDTVPSRTHELNSHDRGKTDTQTHTHLLSTSDAADYTPCLFPLPSRILTSSTYFLLLFSFWYVHFKKILLILFIYVQ